MFSFLTTWKNLSHLNAWGFVLKGPAFLVVRSETLLVSVGVSILKHREMLEVDTCIAFSIRSSHALYLKELY